MIQRKLCRSHSVKYGKGITGLLMYVDEIIVIGSCPQEIKNLKCYLSVKVLSLALRWLGRDKA